MEVCLIPLAVLIPAAIGVYIIGFGWRNMQRAEEARTWPAVEGRIVTSRVAVTKGTKGATFYNPAFTYEYRVKGRLYQGDRMAFGTPTSGKRDEAEEIVARTPPGSAVEVYYNPAHPGESVLDPTPQVGEYVAHFAAGVAFIVLPLAIILCALSS